MRGRNRLRELYCVSKNEKVSMATNELGEKGNTAHHDKTGVPTKLVIHSLGG